PNRISVCKLLASSRIFCASNIPFHHSPDGSSCNCPSKRPPLFGNSSRTTTDKSYCLHTMAADRPAGPAPIITISFIFQSPFSIVHILHMYVVWGHLDSVLVVKVIHLQRE